ncbi:MAG: hypothetical protein ACJAZK_001986 [Psychroserpens sp.]|jgi:hypothetical protein|uniref:DUF2975 domain-containing protein n=1 Tax=Psychroserpens sp. TaxID=2020870 RepID=UPI0039E5BD20
MKNIKSERIFNIMNVVSWIVFVGYCIKAGAICIVSIISLFGNRKATENLYMGHDLSKLFEFSITHYTIVVVLLILIASLKAYLFYLLINIFKRMDFNKPFHSAVVNLIFKISYVAIAIGIIGAIAKSYFTWLVFEVFFTQIDLGTSAYVFMAGVIFIVATLFKRATEIQQENELTI